MAIRYRNPVPGGTVGRTDQGVDISGPPGTPVYAITNETLVGEIPNWYNGQPFYWFKQKGTGLYNYVAEQISLNLRPGQSVKAGQQIGVIAPSGTGLELGFATPIGQTLARASGQTGQNYTGFPTGAGESYRSQVLGGKVTGSTAGSKSGLAQLWIQAGGPANVANLMAAIALAESGGNMGAVNKDANGTTDYGPWQINSVHGFDPQRLTTDPLYSAKAAVAVYKSSGLTAWSTYNSGAYQQFVNGARRATVTYGGTRPGGTGASSPTTYASGNGTGDNTPDYTSLDTPRTAPPSEYVGFFGSIGSFLNGGQPITGLTPKFGINPAPFSWWWKQESQGWNEFSHGLGQVDHTVNDVVNTGKAVDTVAAEAYVIMKNLPWYFLRFWEFMVGLIFMATGFYVMMTSSRRSYGTTGPVGRTLRTVAMATPAGEALRVRRATRAGAREGQEEHHRLAARRAARIQEAGKARHASKQAPPKS